jgi:ADP-ribose pyrophosphatase YjhB (NUDIX family)
MQKKIRPIAVALISNNGKFLAIIGEDKKIGKKFFRAPGGGIEFGETGEEALRREMREEFAMEVEDIKYLGIIENIFQYENEAGHEICLVYGAKINDEKFLAQNKINVLDNESYATWATLDEIRQIPFYPEDVMKFIEDFK